MISTRPDFQTLVLRELNAILVPAESSPLPEVRRAAMIAAYARLSELIAVLSDGHGPDDPPAFAAVTGNLRSDWADALERLAESLEAAIGRLFLNRACEAAAGNAPSCSETEEVAGMFDWWAEQIGNWFV